MPPSIRRAVSHCCSQHATPTYRPFPRHRDEISKIPFYADSIMKMLKDIRRTVSASAKLHPGSNAFTQFLDEVRTFTSLGSRWLHMVYVFSC